MGGGDELQFTLYYDNQSKSQATVSYTAPGRTYVALPSFSLYTEELHKDFPLSFSSEEVQNFSASLNFVSTPPFTLYVQNYLGIQFPLMYQSMSFDSEEEYSMSYQPFARHAALVMTDYLLANRWVGKQMFMNAKAVMGQLDSTHQFITVGSEQGNRQSSRDTSLVDVVQGNRQSTHNISLMDVDQGSRNSSHSVSFIESCFEVDRQNAKSLVSIGVSDGSRNHTFSYTGMSAQSFTRQNQHLFSEIDDLVGGGRSGKFDFMPLSQVDEISRVRKINPLETHTSYLIDRDISGRILQLQTMEELYFSSVARVYGLYVSRGLPAGSRALTNSFSTLGAVGTDRLIQHLFSGITPVSSVRDTQKEMSVWSLIQTLRSNISQFNMLGGLSMDRQHSFGLYNTTAVSTDRSNSFDFIQHTMAGAGRNSSYGFSLENLVSSSRNNTFGLVSSDYLSLTRNSTHGFSVSSTTGLNRDSVHGLDTVSISGLDRRSTSGLWVSSYPVQTERQGTHSLFLQDIASSDKAPLPAHVYDELLEGFVVGKRASVYGSMVEGTPDSKNSTVLESIYRLSTNPKHSTINEWMEQLKIIPKTAFTSGTMEYLTVVSKTYESGIQTIEFSPVSKTAVTNEPMAQLTNNTKQSISETQLTSLLQTAKSADVEETLYAGTNVYKQTTLSEIVTLNGLSFMWYNPELPDLPYDPSTNNSAGQPRRWYVSEDTFHESSDFIITNYLRDKSLYDNMSCDAALDDMRERLFTHFSQYSDTSQKEISDKVESVKSFMNDMSFRIKTDVCGAPNSTVGNIEYNNLSFDFDGEQTLTTIFDASTGYFYSGSRTGATYWTASGGEMTLDLSSIELHDAAFFAFNQRVNSSGTISFDYYCDTTENNPLVFLVNDQAVANLAGNSDFQTATVNFSSHGVYYFRFATQNTGSPMSGTVYVKDIIVQEYLDDDSQIRSIGKQGSGWTVGSGIMSAYLDGVGFDYTARADMDFYETSSTTMSIDTTVSGTYPLDTVTTQGSPYNNFSSISYGGATVDGTPTVFAKAVGNGIKTGQPFAGTPIPTYHYDVSITDLEEYALAGTISGAAKIRVYGVNDSDIIPTLLYEKNYGTDFYVLFSNLPTYPRYRVEFVPLSTSVLISDIRLLVNTVGNPVLPSLFEVLMDDLVILSYVPSQVSENKTLTQTNCQGAHGYRFEFTDFYGGAEFEITKLSFTGNLIAEDGTVFSCPLNSGSQCIEKLISAFDYLMTCNAKYFYSEGLTGKVWLVT